MSQITKMIRLSGSSVRSIEDAIRTVLARAATTIDEITNFEVVKVWGSVDDSGVPTEFSVTVDITFIVKDSVHG
jgi:flavin-binding protein dodecin